MHAHRHPLLRIATFALPAILLAAACGGDSDDGGDDGETTPAPSASLAQTPAATAPPAGSPSAPSLTVDACALVSKAAVEAAVGVSVLDGEPDQAANLFTCSWNDPAFPVVTIAGLAIFVADNPDDASDVFDTGKGNAAEVEEISGIGDAAYWDGILNAMQVLSGRFQVSIDVASEEGRDQVAAAKAIAQEALAGLP